MVVLVAIAAVALVVPGAVAGAAVAILAGLIVADALVARRAPRIIRTLPAVLARGVGVPLTITLEPGDA
ncbi:MAG TPA: hypothetical protein VNT55_00080, partial [Baekduia sp.]|nr:hypothetical protein [Baekduia sp.]